MPYLPDLESLLALRRDLDIVHHLPGRIRLRLGSLIEEWTLTQGLDLAQARDLLRSIPGVLGYRLNPAAASLVIEYDPRRLNPAWWETLVQGDDDAAIALVLGLIAVT